MVRHGAQPVGSVVGPIAPCIPVRPSCERVKNTGHGLGTHMSYMGVRKRKKAMGLGFPAKNFSLRNPLIHMANSGIGYESTSKFCLHFMQHWQSSVEWYPEKYQISMSQPLWDWTPFTLVISKTINICPSVSLDLRPLICNTVAYLGSPCRHSPFPLYHSTYKNMPMIIASLPFANTALSFVFLTSE